MSKNDQIELLKTRLDWLLAHSVVDGAAGGIALFGGMTRAERRESDGAELIALDYEAYEQMAIEQMQQLAAAARQKWPIVKLAMQHRIGRVAVGESSVIIAVACPHRGQAFDACRFLIDELKKVVAIWKKEVWSDGSATWGTNQKEVATEAQRTQRNDDE
jgi:molybdopterin synthase catalytic subunit